MQCPYCKEDNPPGRAKCAFCGEPMNQTSNIQTPMRQTPVIQTPKSQTRIAGGDTVYVSSHLVPAILLMLFCCLPFGVVAIVYAARVQAFLVSGQIAMAQEASEKAKMWCLVSFGSWVAIIIIYFLMILAVVGLGSY
jgi:interferon-induced transmembrane protein